MDKYLCCKDYVDFKKEVLDPLKESIKETSMELKKSKRIINSLKSNLEIVPYLDDIENELPDNNEYDCLWFLPVCPLPDFPDKPVPFPVTLLHR